MRDGLLLGILAPGVACILGWFLWRLYSAPRGRGIQAPAQIRQPAAVRRPQNGSTIISFPAKPAAPGLPQSARSADVLQLGLAGLQADAGKAGKMTGMSSQRMDAPEVSEAQALLLRFDAAVSVQQRLPMVFDPGKVEPLMHAYYRERAQKDPERGRCLAANVMTCGDSRVLSLDFESNSRPGGGLRVWFHCAAEGKLLLDWESYVAWCGQDWTGFKLQHPQAEVTMRVVASESHDYGHEFSDGRRWLALHLSSADGMHSVTGYAERNSPLGSALAGLIGSPLNDQGSVNQPPPSSRESGARVPVTVSLCYPVNPRSDGCVFITRLLADRWLVMPVEMDSGK